MKKYPRYTWVGNQISQEDMTELYKMKTSEHVPITRLVAEAVREFIHKRQESSKERVCLSSTQGISSNN
jgi:hypothetical protein